MSARPSPFLYPVLAVILVVCWSSGFVGIRFTTDSATVAQVLFWRSFVSGLGLLPLALLYGPAIPVSAVWQQGLYALLGMFFYLGGFAVAIGRGVPTGLVALMADLVPLGIAALAAPMLGQPLTHRQWIGTGISLVGVLAVSADALHLGNASVVAYLLPILGMLSFALSTVLQERRQGVELAIYQRLALQCLWAAAMFAPFAYLSGGLAPPMTGDFAFGILWLVLAATYGAWLIYYLCLRLFPPVMVSAAIYLSPPVTMLWAAALFGEPLSVMMGVGVVVTLVGVWLVARRGGI